MAVWIPELGMELSFDEVRVPAKVWPGGKVSADGTRLTLETVLYAISEGNSPERIAEMFPGTKLSDLYLLTGYFLSYREEAEEYLRRCDEEANKARVEIESQPGYKERTQRTLERWRRMGCVR